MSITEGTLVTIALAKPLPVLVIAILLFSIEVALSKALCGVVVVCFAAGGLLLLSKGINAGIGAPSAKSIFEWWISRCLA